MGSPSPLPVILLVEDNPDDALLATIALEETGITNPVVHVEDGHDALDRLRSGPVALVLLDLRLPRLDGAGLLAALREDPLPDRPPVFVMAASTESTASLGVAPPEVDAVLAKPLRAGDVLEALSASSVRNVVVGS